MPNDIAIREAETKDADALAVLLIQLGYPQNGAFVIRKLQELSKRTARVFVADEDGKVLGFLSFRSQPSIGRETSER